MGFVLLEVLSHSYVLHSDSNQVAPCYEGAWRIWSVSVVQVSRFSFHHGPLLKQLCTVSHGSLVFSPDRKVLKKSQMSWGCQASSAT